MKKAKKQKQKNIFKTLLKCVLWVGGLMITAAIVQLVREGSLFGDMMDRELFRAVAVFIWLIPALLLILIPALLFSGDRKSVV